MQFCLRITMVYFLVYDVQNQKLIQNFDVITLHTQRSHLVAKKWMEWLEICHVDSPYVGLQHLFRFFENFKKSSVFEFFKKNI